eukprot:CAMPEP_0113818382 /NCGR_PEP_ID=MMETSP0328-20130328/212_1 /TAXON_ID=39455 /ORGANISM="Alexandrium minutum" /LENGTH=474 /DNA_ID=CAMNT_0000786317 /DNA_START=77 /DNA_END=1501 /DNA_ORIENTATION=- /assembly_acc=CAM_ASM_000350
MAIVAPRLTPEALALAAAGLDGKRPPLLNEGEEVPSEQSEISSVASMGRQITEVSQAQCIDLMEQQCRGFQARETDFWKRQSTTPAERRNMECLDGLKRQISCPMPSNKPAKAEPRLARIQDGSSCSSVSATPSRQVSQVAEAPDEGLIENTICGVVTECNFSVAVSDPSCMDAELIAVSEGFVKLTGYSREEALGENCRFLNEDCEMSEEHREQIHCTTETGRPFVGVIQNRKKNGELFDNLLDLRGLIIARNTRSDEDIWVLIAVQQDVTGMDRDRMPANHLPLLNQVAARIRKRLVKQLAELGLACAMSEIKWPGSRDPTSPRSRSSIGRPTGSWCLATTICWKQAETQAPRPCHVEPLAVTSSAAATSSPSREPCPVPAEHQQHGKDPVGQEPTAGPAIQQQAPTLPQPSRPSADEDAAQAPRAAASGPLEHPADTEHSMLPHLALGLGAVALLGALLTVRLVRHSNRST